MWGKRRKRCGRLSRQLALGMLEDAMARAEQQQEEEAESAPVPYPGAAPAAPPNDPRLRPGDVPVDNSAELDKRAEPENRAEPAAPGDSTPPQQELPAQRTADRTRHGSFGSKNHS
jgi:hypothetical protein